MENERYKEYYKKLGVDLPNLDFTDPNEKYESVEKQ